MSILRISPRSALFGLLMSAALGAGAQSTSSAPAPARAADGAAVHGDAAGQASRAPHASPMVGTTTPDWQPPSTVSDRATYCPPAGPDCPIAESSGSSAEPVVSTDSRPLGSTNRREDPLADSRYPTAAGSGSMGSGTTGKETMVGPSPGPTIGTGR